MGDLAPAIFGLLGVIVGGLLNGALAYWRVRREEFREAVVGARFVSHEVELLGADVDRWIRQGYVAQEDFPLAQPAWDAHNEKLARILHGVDWEMVSATYTWVEIFNKNPPMMEDGDDQFFADVLTEIKGGVLSLKPLVNGQHPRIGLRLRLARRRMLRRELRDFQ